MDIEFMRNQNLIIRPLDVAGKPNFRLIRDNFYSEEDKSFIYQMLVSLVVVLLMVLIK